MDRGDGCMKGWWRRPLVELGLRVDEDREAEGSIPDSTLPVRRPFLIPRFTTRERNARATWFVVLLGGAGLLFWIIAGTLFLTQHSQANAVARIIDYRCPPGS